MRTLQKAYAGGALKVLPDCITFFLHHVVHFPNSCAKPVAIYKAHHDFDVEDDRVFEATFTAKMPLYDDNHQPEQVLDGNNIIAYLSDMYKIKYLYEDQHDDIYTSEIRWVH